MKAIPVAVVATLTVAACTQQYEPDVVNSQSAKYHNDLAECRTVAATLVSQDRPVQSEVKTGAIFGGIIGALDDPSDPLEGAATGAMVGAGVGALDGLDEVAVIERAAIRSCLIERGYQVRG